MAHTQETRTGHTLPREVTVTVFHDGSLTVTWPDGNARSAAILGRGKIRGDISSAEHILADILERITSDAVR